jgi:hypothetical protein
LDDHEVLTAFVEGTSQNATGPGLQAEGATLKLDGWWSLAYRLSDRTFLLRNEDPPRETTAHADVAAALTAKGLTEVGVDLPGIALLSYTKLDLGYAPWGLWSTDLGTGEAELNAVATEETSL